MPIYISSSLAPKNGATWYILDDKYIRGGFHVVADSIERDDTHVGSRKEGMLVLTKDTGVVHQLNADLLTWTIFESVPSAHTHSIADLGLVATDTVSETDRTTWDSKQEALGFTPVDSANVGANSGLAQLDASGKLVAAQLPDISITDTYVVSTELEMLAIVCQVGDVAVRTDLSKSFILKTADSSVLSNWQELLTPSGGVLSVSGTGAITISGTAGAPIVSIVAATTSVSGTMSAADKLKLDGVAASANNYAHPNIDGSLHVPATSTTNNGKVLTAGATAGSLSWATPTLGTVTGISANAPIVSSGGAAPVLSMAAATSAIDGYLKATDWLIFNSKGTGIVQAVTATGPVVSTGGVNPVISLAAANSTTNGYLTSTDWTEFDSKQAALGFTPYDATNPSGFTSNVGTVTNVTGTGAIAVATSTTTPAISIAAASTIVPGTMSAADKTKLDGIAASANNYAHPAGDGSLHVPATSTTNNGKVLTAGATAGSLSWTVPTVGTVTGVSATSPVVSSGGAAPIISMAAATTSIPGYLTAADWNTFNGKQAALGFTPYNATNPSGFTSNTGTVTNVTGSGAISVATGATTPAISVAAASTTVPGTMSAADKLKLDGIASGATAYVHPTTDGNLHVPATSTTNNGKVLTAGATAGSLSWTTPAATGVTSVTGTAPIVSSGGTTPALSISASTTSAAGSMSAADKLKLDGIAASANNYVHPAGDGNLHVPATSTTNNGKILTAGATAGSLSWTTNTSGTVTSVAGAGTVNGLTLSGTVTSTGNLTLGGSVTSVATTGNFQMNSLGVGTAAANTAGDIRATGDVTAFYSDARLKDVSGNIENALQKVLQLNGVHYHANFLAESFGYSTKTQQVGLLAQEVEAVLPEVVVPAPFDIGQKEDGTEFSLSGENYKTVKYDRIVPLLVEAIKEQQKLIDALTQHVEKLSAKA